jgi:hypothetical protein
MVGLVLTGFSEMRIGCVPVGFETSGMPYDCSNCSGLLVGEVNMLDVRSKLRLEVADAVSECECSEGCECVGDVSRALLEPYKPLDGRSNDSGHGGCEETDWGGLTELERQGNGLGMTSAMCAGLRGLKDA